MKWVREIHNLASHVYYTTLQILKAWKTFLKAKLWARLPGDCVDAVVEALARKLLVRMKSMVQQGVGDGSNSLLFATFVRFNHIDGDEEEDGCLERR